MKTILLFVLVVAASIMLQACSIPPSPAVTAHAGGGVVPSGTMGAMIGAQSTVVNMESQKASAFWGGAR